VQGAISPSGEQVELARGDQKAVVVGVGGGLRGYWVGDATVLDGYGLDELCSSGRGQLLAPWPNRIQDGSYEFDGRDYQLALDEPERRNAIHGLVRWSQWTVAEREPDRAALEHRLHPSPGYPFTLDLRVEYSLEEKGLTVGVRATNAGPDPCPYGVGAHPYLAAGDSLVDELELSVPARTALVSDERSIPVDRKPVEGTELDFRVPKAVGSVQLDHCFTDLDRAADGRARVELGGRAALWVDESYPYVMVFTGDALPDVSRRSVAVEPMTCAPNAFRTGHGLIRLEPGQTHSGTWGIVPLR
jgi:aldose 1-epimerase